MLIQMRQIAGITQRIVHLAKVQNVKRVPVWSHVIECAGIAAKPCKDLFRHRRVDALDTPRQPTVLLGSAFAPSLVLGAMPLVGPPIADLFEVGWSPASS